MIPHFFPALLNNTAVAALLFRNGILRVIRDQAPSAETPQSDYVVLSVVGGMPDNYLTDAPGIDNSRVQFDCYSRTQAGADAIYQALIVVLQTLGQVVSFNGTMRDPDTLNYRVSFDVSFWTNRL